MNSGQSTSRKRSAEVTVTNLQMAVLLIKMKERRHLSVVIAHHEDAYPLHPRLSLLSLLGSALSLHLSNCVVAVARPPTPASFKAASCGSFEALQKTRHPSKLYEHEHNTSQWWSERI